MSADTTTERHVVIAVDSSAESHNALEWALRNFNPTDLTFHVVHAYDPVTIIPLSPGGYVIPQDVIDQVNQQERDNAKEVAIPYERRLREAGVKHETEIIRGNVREALVRKAELVKAECLVVGSRGRGAIARALLGSISDYCLHHCSTPVVVVRPDAKE